ncbi:hypothetical protein [Blastomonas sp. AAP53]|uniref:hypothetical protein n=1 Tax=Blastomonas sp. AAP53 TaxID=1248760 RepID=UPI00031E7977|nr:hypothetical protein [Blastomonas sp. AAP53]
MSKTHETTPPTTDQSRLAEKALKLKQQDEQREDPEYLARQTDTPDEGRIDEPSDHNPPMGAFDAEGQRPVLERSRKVR